MFKTRIQNMKDPPLIEVQLKDDKNSAAATRTRVFDLVCICSFNERCSAAPTMLHKRIAGRSFS